EVVEASTIAAATKTFTHIAVDLVVVDGLLPDGDGTAFIETLRAHNRKVRIIFISAFVRDLATVEHLTKKLDVSLVIYKPIDIGDFTDQILQLLGMPKAPAAPSAPPDLAAEIAALNAQYTAKLPEKLQEIETAVGRAKTDHDSIADARGLAHRLRGSAGSYGHPALSEAIACAEDLLAEAQANPSAIRRHLWEEIDTALRDSRLCLERGPDFDQGSPAAAATQKSLLVVDDDPEFLQFVRAVGRKLLLNVVTAQDESEAMQRARTSPLVGAVLDVHLFDGTSFSLAREIRSTAANGQIPIAFASADHRIETRVAAIEAGGTRFFEKPMSEESFAALAQQLAMLSDATSQKVLIVDDDPDVVEHYAFHLRGAGYSVETLGSAVGITEKLEQISPDVLLLDINLPGISGLDVCRALRMSETYEALPIFIVTGQTDDHTRLLAFRAGASDVVAKPVIPEELLARVGVQLERVGLLRDRADKDSLSGLLTRRALVEAFQRALAVATRDEKPLSLVLLDIDRFKRVNDTYGHLAGDQVIAHLGDLLRRRFRLEDLRGRWGGEEFILVFPGQDTAFAERAAALLLEEFSQLAFTSDDGERFTATFTAGVAAYPEDGTSISALVRRADQRLYAGKQRGRNQVVAMAASTSHSSDAGIQEGRI
nr:response regulator [Actinomycetes bacterium]